RRLPLDILKIDQSFTRGIGKSENDEEIVRVMIRMAHAMGLKVICEGCETVEQLRFLQAHDCDYVQGYLFSRPQAAEDITNMILGEHQGSYNIMDVTVQ
ncbi:MAG: EAL domain-containing protein, partial [Gammaproteobacteria bacterium]|nr:EAL domain-containing protein [Gammaproteobacteria bacterium]